MIGIPVRWIAVIVFVLSSSLNMLDRQILAALAPTIKGEFQLSDTEYGFIITAFSLTYAVGAPLAGLFIDRVGLNLGSSITIALWSFAGIATGLATGLRGLIACRAGLGLSEAGGIPGAAKVTAVYLPSEERALGSATSQIGLTIGAVSAPLIASWASVRYGWRSAFFLTGALGFLWIPLWLLTARRVPVFKEPQPPPSIPVRDLVRDGRLWRLVLANMLLMTIYSLWTNWTTIYFVNVFQMPEAQANRQLVWIPNLTASLGGLSGGALALWWIRRGVDVLAARMRVILLSAVALLSTAAIPFMPSPALATALICFSYFSCVAASVNIYAMPLDLFGSARAAFAVSTLTSAYGLMQALFSPIAGAIIDRHGFPPVCMLVAILPLVSWATLRGAARKA